MDAGADPVPSLGMSEVPPVAAPTGWRFLVLIEIANYAMLRRHVGAHKAQALASDVVAALLDRAPHADARVAARDLVELQVKAQSRRELDALLAHLLDDFTRPITLDAERHLIKLNVGAAADNSMTSDEVRLAEEAEQALVDSRSERRPVVRDVAEGALLDRIALARELAVGIVRDEMLIQYQPKLHVRQQKITSVEALIRWRHPEHGLILPNEFIPLAEQSHEIAALTLWTIRRVLADQKMLVAAGRGLKTFINISGVLLTDTAFIQEACAVIGEEGAAIGFEITETAVIRDPQSAIYHLNAFADIGVTIAIDDYGAGLSSLAYLKQLPARELKIDKLFVTQLTSSHRDPLIVRSTIDLAHALEMEVVAEGVETQSSLALLSVMGCDMVQGFLISRPLCLQALIAFLTDYDASIPAKPKPFLRQLTQSRSAA